MEREASICSRLLRLSVFPWCEDSKLVSNLNTDEPLWKGKKKKTNKNNLHAWAINLLNAIGVVAKFMSHTIVRDCRFQKP